MAQGTIESMDSNFTSMHPTVAFLDVLDQYSFNEDLMCKFRFNDYISQEGDRIAIFKLGWSLVKDYIVFEWAPVASKERQCSVIFNSHILPKNSTEIYQLCYISGENEIHGASSPFQFYLGENLMSTSNIETSNPKNSINTLDSISKSQMIPNKDQEILRLKEENIILKESLKALIGQKSECNCKNYDKDIKEVRELVDGVKSMLTVHENEIYMLKDKIREGGEEYKKLYLEKAKVERKYEKLKRNKDDRKSDEIKPINECNFDIGDLKSIPPFPGVILN